MKKTICLLAMLVLCFTVITAPASADSSVMEQGYALYMADEYEAAVPLLREAADQGYATAQHALGYCYAYGLGVEQNDAEALRYYQLAADQGLSDAVFNIGCLYYFGGESTEKNYEKAAAFFAQAADMGNEGAKFGLGTCYQDGLGVEKDPDKAAELYEEALAAGYEPDEDDLNHLKACADGGNAIAQNELGKCCFNGVGVEINAEEAVKYFRLASEQGFADAQTNLGSCYYYGMGVEEDCDKALEYFHEAAELGHPSAMFLIGVSYYEGKGAEQDTEKAAEWFKTALEAGYEPDEKDLIILKDVFGEELPA